MRRKKKKIGLPVRTLIAMFAVTLLLGGAIGGTMAWLTSTSSEVENTFSPSTIEIKLKETDATKDGEILKKSYKMVPGDTLSKDPKVTFDKESEPCWLFVKVEESTNFGIYMSYDMADGWNKLDGQPGVYYREVNGEGTPAMVSANTYFEILANNEVTVSEDVTKDQMDALTESNYPTLSFKAYAIQKANIDDAAIAWSKLNP